MSQTRRSYSSLEHARLAVESLRAHFDTPHISFLIRYEDGQLWPCLDFGLFSLMDGLAVPPGKGLSWAALDSGSMIFSPAAHEDSRAFDPVSELGPPHAQLTAPLLGRAGQPLGVIHVALEHPREFSQADQDWFRTLGQRVAAHLEESLSRERNFEESLEVLSIMLDEKKHVPAGRTLRLARLVRRMTGFLGLAPSVAQAAYWGTLLCHASALEDADRSRAGTSTNYAAARSERAQQALAGFPLLPSASAQLVLHQDQRWDGHGSPGHLAAEAIPHLARIFAVCDALLTALESRREPALALRDEAGHRLDPVLVEALLEMPDLQRV